MVCEVLKFQEGIGGGQCPAHNGPAPDSRAAFLFYTVVFEGLKKALPKKNTSIKTIEMMHAKAHFMVYDKGFLLLPKYYHKKTSHIFIHREAGK